jgi:hypothetical protein
MALVARYLRPGGSLIFSGEHPAYSCLEWNGTQYAVAEPYCTEGSREYGSWKGVPIVIQRRTLGTFIGQIIQAGLQIEALVETPLNPAAVKDAHIDPARWYSEARARVMPTTFIIKARKPACV